MISPIKKSQTSPQNKQSFSTAKKNTFGDDYFNGGNLSKDLEAMPEEELSDENSVKDGSFYAGANDKSGGKSPVDNYIDDDDWGNESVKETVTDKDTHVLGLKPKSIVTSSNNNSKIAASIQNSKLLKKDEDKKERPASKYSAIVFTNAVEHEPKKSSDEDDDYEEDFEDDFEPYETSHEDETEKESKKQANLA